MTPTDLSALATPPAPLVSPGQWAEFFDWAHEAGYDESWFNRWDSKSLWLQEQFLDKLAESEADEPEGSGGASTTAET